MRRALDLLAGRLVEVDALGLFLSTLQVVVLPVAAGVAINRFLPLGAGQPPRRLVADAAVSRAI